MPNLNNETKVYHPCTALRAYVRMGQSLAGVHTNARTLAVLDTHGLLFIHLFIIIIIIIIIMSNLMKWDQGIPPIHCLAGLRESGTEPGGFAHQR